MKRINKINQIELILYDKIYYISNKTSKNKLIAFFIDQYVPYVECFRKCSKSVSCKYTSLLKNEYSDQKCILLKNIIKNYFKVTYSMYKPLTTKKKQVFLTTSMKFFDLLYDLEFDIGILENESIIKFINFGAPSFIGKILNERRKLEEIAFLFNKFKALRSRVNVYLVEGICDQIILNSLANGRIANFDFLKNNIDTMDGKDKIRKGRFDLLIRNKLKRNERTILILDGDGKSKKNKINDLKKYWNSKPKLIRKKDIYIFKNTIESAFPIPMLSQVLKEYIKKYQGKTIHISEKEIKKIVKNGGDIINIFGDKYSVQINKKIFDSMLADLLNFVVSRNYSDCMQRKKPFNAEIFRFLNFLYHVGYS